MSCFIGLHGNAPRSRILNVAARDYDPDKANNTRLATLGVVPLNSSGIVTSDAAKTGWVNWWATLKYEDSGRTRTVQLTDITFWVNRGGNNWLSFAIGKAYEVNSDGTNGAEVPVSVSLGREGADGTVTVVVAGKYAFHPSIKDRSTLDFIPVAHQA
jgi:hypothetical protein